MQTVNTLLIISGSLIGLGLLMVICGLCMDKNGSRYGAPK